MHKWRIGIAGAGGIAAAHLDAIREEPRAEAVAIADAWRPAAEEKAGVYGIARVYDDYQTMLHDQEVDVVIICLPNHLHAPVSLEALSAGKHVLCEKPMAMNSQEAAEMKARAEQAGRVLMVAQNNRFRGDAQLLKQLVDNSKLGRIYHAKTGWVRRSGIPGWGSWFTTKEHAGGGALIDIGVHMLDLTMWLMGSPRPVSVFGQTYAEFGPRHKGLSAWGRKNEQGCFDVEDFATALIRFEDGSTLSLDARWAAYQEKEQAYVHLFGSEAGATFDFFEDRLTLYHDEDGLAADTSIATPQHNERVLLLAHFLDVLEKKTASICPPEQSVAVTHILEAIYESARTGESVRL